MIAAVIVLSMICIAEFYVIAVLFNRLLVKNGIQPIAFTQKQEEEAPEAEIPRRKKIFSVPIED